MVSDMGLLLPSQVPGLVDSVESDKANGGLKYRRWKLVLREPEEVGLVL